MTNTLQNWYNNGNINYSEKQKLNTMGVNDYDYHYLQDLRKMLECEEVAKRRGLYVPGQVHQVNFFSTWFNPNCAAVICGEHGSHELRLVIHEPRQGGMAENLENRQITTSLSYGGVQSQANHTEDRLKNSENPILQVHTGQIDAFAHAWSGISLTELPMVVSETLPYSSPSSLSSLSPDHYFRPLDIMKRPTSIGVEHSAVYLGNGMVAHVAGKGTGARVVPWSDFLGGSSSAISDSSAPGGGRVTRYHPIIPYKHQGGTNGIIEHIARAVASDEYDTSYRFTGIWQGFNRTHGNCQHFSNRCVFGLNFSEEGTDFKKKVPLTQEIGDTDREFRNLTIRDVNQNYYRDKKSQIENSVDLWRNNYQGQKFEAKIEVRPNPPCKIQ